MSQLKNKIALVTGASSGIGAATAHALAREGAKLILTARRLDRLEALAATLKDKYQTPCFILELDVRDSEKIAHGLYQLPKAFQPIDILINNAGLAAGLDFIKDANLDDWEAMIDTNIKGLIYVTRAILPHMLAKNSGHIINISSIAAHYAYPGGSVYCGTKAFVKSFTRSLKQECINTGVKVTDIAPGAVETEFSEVRFKGDQEKAKKVYADLTPMKGEDISDAIIFALTRPSHVSVAEIIINALEQKVQLV
jgi:3-hydroxy acid dehydrogenase / malonic semialdehyde reductase